METLEFSQLIICIFLYVSMQFVESVSFSSKVAGKLSNNLSQIQNDS